MKNWQEKDNAQKADVKPLGKCMAHGCPVWATQANSVLGKETNWCCPIHATAPAEHWQTVTANIRHELFLVELIRDVRSSFAGKPFDVKGRLAGIKDHGFDDLMPCEADQRHNGKFSMRKWGARLDKILSDRVMRGIDSTPTASGEQVTSSAELLADEVDQFLKKHAVS